MRTVSLGGRGVAYARLVVFWLLFAAVMACVAPVAAAIRNHWVERAVFGAVVTAGTIGLTLWFARNGWTRLSECGLGFDRRTPARFGLGVVLGLLLLAVPVTVLAGIESVRWAPVPHVNPAVITGAIASYLVLACMEEVGFRGYPVLGLARALGLWTAQALAAVAFITFHVVGGQPVFSAILGTGLGSLLFGMAAVASRGLALPIGLHASWNIGSWALGDKGDPGVWTPVFAHPPGVAGTLTYVASFLLWTIGFLIWTRRSSEPHTAWRPAAD